MVGFSHRRRLWRRSVCNHMTFGPILMIPAETRVRTAHAPVLNYQCPGSCLLILAVGFWLYNWEVGVGRILLLSWDDIPSKSQAQAPYIQSSRNMTLKNYLKLIDPFCQSDRSLWQHHLVLFSMNRQHYNKVFLSEVKLPIFPKTGNTAALRHQILNQFVNLKSHVLI